MQTKPVLPWMFSVLVVMSSGSVNADPRAAANATPTRVAAVTPVAPAPATLSPAGEGRRLFLKLNCYSCHGMRAAGGMGPNIVHAEIGDLREVVLQGSDEGMPSFRNYVSATDLNNLAAYLASIGTKTEPRFVDWWVAVPTK